MGGELSLGLRSNGVQARSCSGVDEIVTQLASEAISGDTVLIMSNGAFGNIWEKLLAALEAGEANP